MACADFWQEFSISFCRLSGALACLAPKEHLMCGSECLIFRTECPIWRCVREMVVCPPSPPCLHPTPWPSL